jgi:hypothetical protein
MANRYSTMNVPAIRAPMLTPAPARSEKVEGRKAWRHMMKREDSPFDRAMVMKSSCNVLIRSDLSRR